MTPDELFTDAHTAYAFTDQPVTDAHLEQIYELVKFAPTPMNSQALRVLFVRTPEGKARLLPHLAEMNRPKSASAPAVAVLAYDTEFHRRLPENFPQNPTAMDSYADPEKREAAAKQIAGLQAGYFILAVRASGLDAGPMSGFSTEGVNAEFFPGTSWKSLYVVNMGHAAPEGTRPRNPRVDKSSALMWA